MLSIYKGHHCQHRSDDFPDLAAIITPHKPKLVVELGTDEGGFSGWLADLVKPWGGYVHTFDLEQKFKPTLLSDFQNLFFSQADVLSMVNPRISLILPRNTLPFGPRLLYCDNGNKQREIELYAPLLEVGDLLATHDYNTEVMASWAEPYVKALGFVPEGHERMEALRNEWYTEPMTRFWVRRYVP